MDDMDESGPIADDIAVRLYRMVDDHFGFYPAGTYEHYGKDNQTYTARTDWQEGWNAAIDELGKQRGVLFRWLKALPAPHRATIEQLLRRDKLELHAAADETVAMAVNCNDIFAWGTAESEPITVDELDALVELIDQNELWGDTLWTMRKRNEKPQRPVEKMLRNDGAWPDWAEELNENQYDAWRAREKEKGKRGE